MKTPKKPKQKPPKPTPLALPRRFTDRMVDTEKQREAINGLGYPVK